MKTLFLPRWFVLVAGFFFIVFTRLSGQEVAINFGVDTTDTEIKQATTLWINYLKSRPNAANLNDTPYWADSEKKRYRKVDQLLNAINSEVPTYAMGSATVLYVKPGNGFTEIKTLFGWSDSLQNVYALCIASVFAKKENGQYRLYNALTVNGNKWQTQKMGSVTFHYPPTHSFTTGKASKLLQSIESLTTQWKLPIIPIDYYFADTYDELQHLRGLNYAAGMGNADRPGGMADPDARIVFAGGLGENYFHEVVHIYLNSLFPRSPLVEGLAVFYGGSLGHDLKWHLKRLDTYLTQHPDLNLTNVENFWYMDNFTNPTSAIQGLLCLLAYNRGGLPKLKQLMVHENVYTAIEKEFGVTKDGLHTFLREQISLHKN